MCNFLPVLDWKRPKKAAKVQLLKKVKIFLFSYQSIISNTCCKTLVKAI